jgi:hypothetical protein
MENWCIEIKIKKQIDEENHFVVVQQIKKIMKKNSKLIVNSNAADFFFSCN